MDSELLRRHPSFVGRERPATRSGPVSDPAFDGAAVDLAPEGPFATGYGTADAAGRTGRSDESGVDGPTLARLVVDHGVGVQVASTRTRKRLDLDYVDAL